MKGWVYIITNKSMPNIVKVGFSKNDPKFRAKQLDTAAPSDYVVEYDALVNEYPKIEKKSQALLDAYHINKEWFSCSVEIAITAIRQAATDNILHEYCQFEISAISKTVIQNEATETERKNKERIAENYIKVGSESEDNSNAIENFEMALKIYEELNNKKGIVKTYSALTFGYWGWANESEAKLTAIEKIYNAIEFGNKSLEIYTLCEELEFDDINYEMELQYEVIAQIYNSLACIYENLNEYEKVIQVMSESLRFFSLANCEISLAINYEKMGNIFHSKFYNWINSIDMHEKALEIYENILTNQQIKDNAHVVNIIENIAKNLQKLGVLYPLVGKKDKAIQVYEKSLKIHEDLDDKTGMTEDCNGLIDIYQTHNSEKCIEMLQKILEIHKLLDDKSGIASDYTRLGNEYESLNKLDDAIEMYENALQNYIDNPDEEIMVIIYVDLGNIYKKIGNKKNAKYYYQKGLELSEYFEFYEAKEVQNWLNELK